jgi:hypothetical protein
VAEVAKERSWPPWWVRDPGRLAAEHAAVTAAGGRVVAEVPGTVSLLWELAWPDGEDLLWLLVSFGLAYPWLPPEVSCQDPPAWMTRHRNPSTGRLCLTADGADFDPTTLLADLLRTQLPKIRAANQPGFVDPAVEEPVALGPRSWQTSALAVVYAGPPPPPGLDAGHLAVREAGLYVPQWWVTGLLDAGGHRLWSRNPTMPSMSETEALVPFVRLPDEPDTPIDPAALWARAEPLLPPTATAGAPQPASQLQLAAVYTPGEVSYWQTGWQLYMLIRQRADARRRWQYGLGLVEPGGRRDLAARTPRGHDLAGRAVLVVGLGAIGHRVAIDLARAGVGHLVLVDHDTVAAGAASRQLPLEMVGMSKVTAVGVIARQHNPYLRVTCDKQPIGGGASPDIRNSMDQVDLVVDATANPPVTRYLAHAAAAAGAPFVTAAATAGGRGGHVLRLPATGGGCYACAEQHREYGSLPAPPEIKGGWITPPGCGHPTYLGHGHDLAIIATQATRLAVAQLTGAKPPGDVWIADIPTDGGPPTWRADPLRPHPACPVCATTGHGPR